MFKDYSFVFDIDGTICPIKKKEEKYEDLVPYKNIVEKIKYYKNNGAKIVLYTSRNMNSYNGNIGLINKHTASVLTKWLEKWEIPYDEIVYGKVWPGHKGFYVDDRTIRPDEFLNNSIEELEGICEKSRSNIKLQGRQNKIDIVITMGGLGSRFRKMGYDFPKYMIEAKGKTLFEWSMISLEGFKDSADKYIFIALKDEKKDVESFIETELKKLDIKKYHIIIIDELTDGQATTAMLAKKYWNSENSLLIYNIDTYVEKNEMKTSQLKGDGFIPCFQAPGNHWSFVRLNENNEVVEIKEKERISNYCTIGAYYFKTCKLYQNLYDEFYSEQQFSKEKYVAPLYDYLLKKGGKIYISDIDSKKVHVLGTPEELEEFLK